MPLLKPNLKSIYSVSGRVAPPVAPAVGLRTEDVRHAGAEAGHLESCLSALLKSGVLNDVVIAASERDARDLLAVCAICKRCARACPNTTVFWDPSSVSTSGFRPR